MLPSDVPVKVGLHSLCPYPYTTGAAILRGARKLWEDAT